MTQCLIYCRVSTEEQAEKGYSLDTQEKLCRDYAERNGYQVTGVFRDEGKSGTTLSRPALQDLLAKCTKGTVIGAIFVQETDRLARNTHDHLTIRALLQKAGVKLISVAQPMLDDSPEGKMIDTILASVNQFQSDLSGRKVRKALQEKYEQGWWPSLAPIGYMNVAVEEGHDGRRARKVVRPDPDNWSVLQEGFKLYLTGDYSADEIRDFLHKKGVRSKTGKRIPHSVMVRTLKSPFYAGIMEWKGQRHIGRHKPMISTQEHKRICQIIDSHNLHACRRRKHSFLLRGFAFCNLCGQRYTAELHPSRNKAYYHCAARSVHSNRHQNIQVDSLERQVEECFKSIQFSEHFVDDVTATLKAISVKKKHAAHVRKHALLNRQKLIEAKRDRAEEKLLEGTFANDAFVRVNGRMSEQLQNIREELASLENQHEYDTEVIREVLLLSTNSYKAYKEADGVLKRHFLQLFWESFLVEDRHIVKAIPSRIIRDLQQQQDVIIDSSMRARPTRIITINDRAYMTAVRTELLAIRSLQREANFIGSL
jgi:DNA invertase Pin-like site-specific DNA recombinase